MSGDNTISSIVGGTGAIGAGVAILPTTSGNWLMTTMSILLVVCGAAIVTAFVVTKIAKSKAQ